MGNFAAGHKGPTAAFPLPGGRRVVVLARGNLWFVDPITQEVESMSITVDGVWEIPGSEGALLSVQSLGFARLGPFGIDWFTQRLSFHGFSAVHIKAGEALGLAWDALEEQWVPFEVELSSGRSRGGAQCRDPGAWMPALDVSPAT